MPCLKNNGISSVRRTEFFVLIMAPMYNALIFSQVLGMPVRLKSVSFTNGWLERGLRDKRPQLEASIRRKETWWLKSHIPIRSDEIHMMHSPFRRGIYTPPFSINTSCLTISRYTRPTFVSKSRTRSYPFLHLSTLPFS